MEGSNKYEMTIDLNVLDHLGINLYSSTPPVLSEVVANSYDADATRVDIKIVDGNSSEIRISDNGEGMDIEDINRKYLHVGYRRRENDEAVSKKFHRQVMGRKGLGKLSLLSIARCIEIHTKKESSEGEAFVIRLEDLQSSITKGEKTYHPAEIEFKSELVEGVSGTTVIIRNIKSSVNRTESFLRPRIAKRFSLRSTQENPFRVFLNDREITPSDRGYQDKVDFIWCTENYREELDGHLQNKIQGTFGDRVGKNYEMKGWIGTVQKPSQLKSDGVNNNQISIFIRGKLAQEDILSSYGESGFYANYMVGEIHADFLDLDDQDDIATSNRQQINENDDRFEKLKNVLYSVLKQIQSEWSELRREQAVDKATKSNNVLGEWYERLSPDERPIAQNIFHVIEKAEFDKEEDKKSLYKYGILAFEKLRIKGNLRELEEITDETALLVLGRILKNVQDVEESLYYDIVQQRLQVIEELKDHLDNNVKERVVQTYLFEHLWLLDPSWDTPIQVTGRKEERIQSAFKDIDASLTEEERSGRVDIRYQTVAGKHVIIELKRYKINYKYDKYDAARQIEKYIEALRKCLKECGEDQPSIEAVLVVGPDSLSDDLPAVNEELKNKHARAVTYDDLISSAEEKYKEFLKASEKARRIERLIESL